MLSLEILLRQRYSLSLFITTSLIALTTQSSLAFSINPLGPVGATASWTPQVSYTLDNQTTGITRLSPTAVRSITRGGTTAFLRTLRQSFQDWTFNVASNDLNGRFDVSKYDAVYGVTDYGNKFTGGRLELQYTPATGDPQGNTLRWIQRIVNNHSLLVPVSEGHGTPADMIDVNAEATNPFYNTSFSADERTFSDTSTREAENNHNWLGELYLVELIAPRQVRIYNGIQWGWENRVESVPEPLTIFGSGVSLGFGVLFKKKVQGNRKKQKASKD